MCVKCGKLINCELTKKAYLVKVDIRDGEYEYGQMATYKTGTTSNRNLHEEILKFIQEWFGFGKGSHQIIRLRGFQEIDKNDYIILKKYGI